MSVSEEAQHLPRDFVGLRYAQPNLRGLKRRYFISTLEHVKTFAHAVRAHWGVENALHWVLDVTFREDDSRIRTGHAPANFNIIRQLALNLLKREPSKLSIKRKRFRAALSDTFREKIVFYSV